MCISELQKEDIYRDYHSKVFGYLVSRVNDHHVAEDLTSDIFVKIYEKFDSFDQRKASLSTWIYTIARNTLIDHYRTQRVFEEVPETLSDGYSVEDEICSGEMLEELVKALEALDKRERDIIILRFYSGKTLKEIAAKMGISYAYIKVLQNKALEKMRKYLD